MTVTVRLTATAHPWFAGAAGLFDDYRQHYGANPAPEAVEAWLRDLVVSGRERVYVAGDDDLAYGICSVAVVPAALTLRTVWLVRDLFVRADMRDRGVARTMLDEVADEARSAGAHRVSLQTETVNLRAIGLYRRTGFEAQNDVTLMDRML